MVGYNLKEKIDTYYFLIHIICIFIKTPTTLFVYPFSSTSTLTFQPSNLSTFQPPIMSAEGSNYVSVPKKTGKSKKKPTKKTGKSKKRVDDVVADFLNSKMVQEGIRVRKRRKAEKDRRKAAEALAKAKNDARRSAEEVQAKKKNSQN